MPTKTSRSAPKAMPKRSKSELGKDLQLALGWLKDHASKKTRDEMETRYAIHTKKAFGVPMSSMQNLAKTLGKDHELALALWETGWYEARIVAAYVDEPERVTAAQMDRWCSDFDNWGICDTVCFVLFDRTPHAFGKVKKWAAKKPEFIKRAAFALFACLALHDKTATEDQFLKCFPLIEYAATDDRNFVKKGVSWALRLIGRRNRRLNTAAVRLAKNLLASEVPSARWIGREAARELTNPTVVKRLKI